MLNAFNYAAIAAICVAWGGCATSESDTSQLPEKYAEHVTEIMRVSDLLSESSSGMVTLDLRHTATGYWFEPGIDYSAIDVVCPSGIVMDMEAWFPQLALEFGTSVSELRNSFIMFSRDVRADPDNAPICEEGCYAHRESNNTWVCLCY